MKMKREKKNESDNIKEGKKLLPVVLFYVFDTFIVTVIIIIASQHVEFISL